MTICAIVSGSDGWESIAQFGEEKEDWLRQWITLENGIPSYDCIARVLARIPASEMTDCFIAWVKSIADLTEGEVVAIDGKTLRHSYSSYNKKDKLGAVHMVSAWANQPGLSLSQIKTEEKSNEITAIPALLNLLEVKGCIITGNCQTEITAKIIEKKRLCFGG